MKVLIIDDEPDVAALVGMGITHGRPNYTVLQCTSGARALDAISTEHPDVVLLDLSMPERDGFAVLKELRDGGNDVPVIVLTAKGLESDKVRGLELGADDYITKPFRARELLARIAAHLRRVREDDQGADGKLDFKDLSINLNERRVFREATEVELTHTEFDLLAFLATNAGKVLSREKILNHVWGYEYPIETRVIDVHVRNLRRKIEEDPGRPFFILAVPGIGYRFTSSAGGG